MRTIQKHLTLPPPTLQSRTSKSLRTASPRRGKRVVDGTDQEGCEGVSPVSTITIHELPVLGDLTVLPDAVCSGAMFDITLNGITVDDGLNINDVQYTWSADVNGVNLPVLGTGSNVTTTPSIDDVPYQDFVGPELLSLQLTASVAGCTTTAEWDDVAEVYPNPLAEVDNEFVCIGQNWETTITGCEVLTVYVQNGLPDITWTTADPSTGIDISLSPTTLRVLAPKRRTHSNSTKASLMRIQDSHASRWHPL